MPYLTGLATAARRTGYPVTTVAGWKRRGHGPQPAVRGIVAHHTAGPAGGGNYPSLGVVKNGRAGLSGPLSHLGLGRDGRIYVIAAGMCYHNAPSTSAAHSNQNAIGIEAENNGRQKWPDTQLDAYYRLCAELCRTYDLPAERVKGHKEVQHGKPDPHSLNMNQFRKRTKAAFNVQEDDDVPTYVSVSKTKDSRREELESGEWQQIYFDHNNSGGADDHHADSGDWPSLVRGPADYTGYILLRIEGVPEGSPCQARTLEVTDKDGSWEVVERDQPVEFPGTAGATFVHVPATGYVNKNNRLRVEVIHQADEGTPTVVGGEVRIQVWER